MLVVVLFPRMFVAAVAMEAGPLVAVLCIHAAAPAELEMRANRREARPCRRTCAGAQGRFFFFFATSALF